MTAREPRLLSQRQTDLIFLGQIIANVVAWALVGVLMAYLFAGIQRQNEVQICAQHAIMSTQKQSNRSLGLPTEKIILPDIEGLDCPKPESSPPP